MLAWRVLNVHRVVDGEEWQSERKERSPSNLLLPAVCVPGFLVVPTFPPAG